MDNTWHLPETGTMGDLVCVAIPAKKRPIAKSCPLCKRFYFCFHAAPMTWTWIDH